MKNIPLRKSILIAFSLVFLLLIALICAVCNRYVRESVVQKEQTYLQSYTASIAQQTAGILNDMNKISVLVYSSKDIGSAFSTSLSYAGGGNCFTRQTALYSQLDAGVYAIVGPDITDIIVNLYNEKGFYSSKYYPIDWESVQNSRAGGRLQQAAQALGDAGGPVVEFLQSAYWTDEDNAAHRYLALTRRFEKYTTRRVIGNIEVLMPVKFIERLFQTAAPGQFTLLVDGDGRTLYQAGALQGRDIDNVRDFLAESFATSKAQSFTARDGSAYSYGVGEIPRFGLRIVTFQKYDAAAHLKYTAVVLLAGLILYACMLALCVVLSRRLSDPLNRIVNSLRGVSWDRLEMNLDLAGRPGEFDVLEEAYSAMLVKLRQSLHQAIEARLNEQRATYLALQSQISPHFLYNTIANISACAYENGVYKIVDICDKLSSLLRYATDFTHTFSDIEDELQYTEDYLELMKARYEDRFFYRVSRSEDCVGIDVPRLIVQSVIENCFQHAFRDAPSPWFISVEAYAQDGWWLIDIAHNGSRIPPETLQQILLQSEALYRSIESGGEHLKLGGLGLLNSIARLRLFCENRIRFEVLPGKEGSTITRLGGPCK